MSEYREQLCELVDSLSDEPLVCAEIGVHRGRTSAMLLQRFPRMYLYMVDAWDESPEGSDYRQTGDPMARYSAKDQEAFYREAMRLTQFAATRREVLRMDSVGAAQALRSVQLAFIDGDHSYAGCKRDIEAWWPRVTAILAGHDYGKDEYGVTEAVDEFCAANGLTLNTGRGHVWWIDKR